MKEARFEMTNIKYIGNGPDRGKVHIKESSEKTGCGAIIVPRHDKIDANDAIKVMR
jgi:hypothetical protein